MDFMGSAGRIGKREAVQSHVRLGLFRTERRQDMFRKLLLAIAFLAGTGASVAIGVGMESPAAAQPGGRILGCPATLDARVRSLVCNCSAEATATGPVYGSEVYTDDSSICRAARHDGVIGPRGGIVEVHESRGLPGYEAATRNGVSSTSWGVYDRSIEFRHRGVPREAGDDDVGGRSDRTWQARSGGRPCPANAGSINGGLSCSCSAAAANSQGGVFGSGPYTTDSDVCRAARHAGAIGPRGGVVSLRIVRGQSSYRASVRNGVSSFAWGSYDSAFVFDR